MMMRRRKNKRHNTTTSTSTSTSTANIINKNNNIDNDNAIHDGGDDAVDPTSTTTSTSTATAVDVVTRHPLIYILGLFGIPYLLYVAYRWILLQRPELLLQLPLPLPGVWEELRPAVRLQDKRQVLILGSMSSGTSSMAQQLSTASSSTSSSSSYSSSTSKLKLEVGHEDSDTEWQFVRDGTVSWFHGIRYWPISSASSSSISSSLSSSSLSSSSTTTNETELRQQQQLQLQRLQQQRQLQISQLCKVQYMMYRNAKSFGDNYGFGPTLFGTPQYNCSWWQQAAGAMPGGGGGMPASCYRHACEQALEREYACATTTTTTTTSSSCVPPFQTTLLQTREPWKIVASLTAKYCYQQQDDDNHNNNNHHDDNTKQKGKKKKQGKKKQGKIVDTLPPTLHWLFLALQVTTLSVPPPTTNTTTHKQQQQQQPQPRHCVVQLIDYVHGYYTKILQTAPDMVRYHIEDLHLVRDDPKQSTCRILQLAGLDRLETTVYPPNHFMYQEHCASTSTTSTSTSTSSTRTSTTSSSSSTSESAEDVEPTIVTKQRTGNVNAINQGRVHWQDLLEYTTEESIQKMKELYRLLDYTYPPTS